jgi:hypothetical protein
MEVGSVASVRTRKRRGTRLGRLLAGALACLALSTASPSVSTAQDPQDARSAGADLAHASDFRVRVSAALLLGKTKPEGARHMLERALDDAHAAVRVAAAAALASLGDPAAVPAIQSHLAGESSGSAKAQMQTTIAALSHRDTAPVPPPAHARYVVEIGQMRNMTPAHNGDLTETLRQAARAQAQSLPGAAVYDAGDPQIDRAAGRMPVLLLEGSLTRLSQAQSNGSIHIDARVEFSVRRVPQQTLKGTLSGGASSVESMRSLNSDRLAELTNQTIGGAVESAMRGADRGLELAAK